ncbi:MAG: hypothetical protein ACXVXJ_04605 [Mycobacteriaceae bacterium]
MGRVAASADRGQRLGRARRSAFLVASALLLAACSNHGGAADLSSQHPLKVATGLDAGVSRTAGLTGRLNGRVNVDGTACFWVHFSGKPGSPPGDIAILWLAKSVAYDRPLRVVDGSGYEMARVGHVVTLGGGNIEKSQLPLLGCAGFTSAFG